jgi:hypothetical protein
MGYISRLFRPLRRHAEVWRCPRLRLAAQALSFARYFAHVRGKAAQNRGTRKGAAALYEDWPAEKAATRPAPPRPPRTDVSRWTEPIGRNRPEMIAGERDPFVLGQWLIRSCIGDWLIRYNIFAGDVFELPSISPARGVAIFKPKDCSGRVRWDVLNIRPHRSAFSLPPA